MPDYKELNNIIANGGDIVFFGGAGVSTESGIPDFRSTDGLYSMTFKHPPETMLSRGFFMSNTEEFFEFYKNKMLFLEAMPNKCHLKLAELEKKGRVKAVVTQNIDGLHQKAGSENVLELHGSVHRNYCMKCGQLYDVGFILNSPAVPKCGCGGIVRPDVVLYGETLDNELMARAVRHIMRADILIIGGTSLGVYPAASLCECFQGRNLVLINKSATNMDSEANLIIRDSIGEVFSKIQS